MIEELKKMLDQCKEDPKVGEVLKEYVPEDLVKAKAEELFPSLVETEVGKKTLQPILDRHATKAIDTWKNNHLQTLLEEELEKRNPAETPEQKQLRELQSQMTKLQKEKTLESMKSLGLQIANEKGLPSSMVNFFVGESPEQTRNNLNLLEIEFKSSVEKAVEERLKASSRTPEYTPEPGGKELDVDNMSMAELNQLATDNPELFARLTGRQI